jgi:hypothetical protein
MADAPDSVEILKGAAKLLRKRDSAAARLQQIDEQLRRVKSDYNRATGVHGAGMDNLRRDCVARGLLNRQ